jgi:ZIP family zinc transporter
VTSELLLFLLVPTGVTLLGGFAAVWWSPSDRIRSWTQHFAAGVVTAAFAVELLPEIEAKHRSMWVTLGSFAVGGGLMYCLKWLFTTLERNRTWENKPKRPLGLVVATGIDVLMDGLVIGIGFASSRETGTALAIGLSAEMLFLGLAVAVELPEEAGRWMPLALTGGLSLALLAGAIGGALALGSASDAVVAGGLAFGAAALLYLVTEELLVEAHAGQREGPGGAAMLFFGFLLFWAIRRLTGSR